MSKILAEKLFNYKGVIYFGVPEETNNLSLSGGERKTNNATILAIQEHGSPVKNIPPRELLQPVLKKYERQIQKSFERVLVSLMNGDEDGANREMERLAIRVEGWAKKFFTDIDNNWVPNAPSTIKAKGSDRPLIDTGSLRAAIRAIFDPEGRR